jgi:hypothetical protein
VSVETGVPFLLTVEFNGGVELLKLASRLQITARKYGFKPVWLIGTEALRHPEALEPLARWQRDGEAEVGGLLEPALVPPLVDLGELSEGRKPFLTDFPESVMDEKLAWFASSLEQAVGKRAVTVRAARPSVDDRYYSLLAKHGFKVDLSVVPHAKIDTSDFTGYSEKPYLTPQGIFEVPRTVRRHKYGPLIEDLLVLPGLPGQLVRSFFPTLRCFRLRRGNMAVVRRLIREGLKSLPEHFDLRIGVRDWTRGEGLLRDLERTLASVQTAVRGVTAEEFVQLFKNKQLRKGLV